MWKFHLIIQMNRNVNNKIIFQIKKYMKYLIKTDDYASLDPVDYGRVVYDTTNDKVFLQNIGGGRDL